MTTTPSLTVAVLQSTATSGEITANLDSIERAANSAVGADVLVTPELFITNYDPPSLATWYDEAQMHFALIRLQEIAAVTQVAIVASLPYIRGSETLIAAVFQPPHGDAIVYYKTHLFADEKLIFVAGDEPPPVFPYKGFKLSMMVCFDVEFPEMVREVSTRGAEVLLVPTALMYPFDEPARILIPARAFENHIAIAYSNHIGQANADLALAGDSVVVGPHGRDLCRAAHWAAKADVPASQIITAVVLRQDALDSKRAFNYLDERRTGAYQRWSATAAQTGEPSETP